MGLSGGFVEDTKAVVEQMFATMAPVAEGGTALIGNERQIPFADHVHPRLSATARGTLSTGTGADAGVEVGTRLVTFTQVFDVEPAVNVISIGAKASGKTVPDFDVTFTTNAEGKFIGCVVFGQRSRALPVLAQASGGLLGALVTSLNAVLAPLSGFSPIEPAAGAAFSLIAVKSSQPPAP